jgi:hypothetical protein
MYLEIHDSKKSTKPYACVEDIDYGYQLDLWLDEIKTHPRTVKIVIRTSKEGGFLNVLKRPKGTLVPFTKWKLSKELKLRKKRNPEKQRA